MRWVVSCTPDTKTVTEKLFQGAVTLNYFNVSDDERTAAHSLNSAIAEAQTLTFNEDVMMCIGPNACSILNTPHSPVRTILAAYFSKSSASSMTRSAAGMMPGSGFSAGPSTSNSSPENRLVTISISSYNNSSLAEGGMPLALKVAQGLGIVSADGNNNQWIRSPFANLNFGDRKSTGHVVQVMSATEADSIINTLFTSPSFQRHLHGMSLCVRLTFSIFSDAANDGDDFPHWVNEQIISLWFVNNRHIDEFLYSFENSVRLNKPARIILGFAKITTLASAAQCADAAAHAWQIVNRNGQFRPVSIAGRPLGPNQLSNNVMSPFSRDLQSTHDFAVNQRKRLLEETAAYISARKGNDGTGRSQMELQESRDDLEKIGKMYDESETKFHDIANQLEKERNRYRVTEDEAKVISDTIDKYTETLKAEEEKRKTMIEKVMELTKERDALQANVLRLKEAHTAMLRQRAIDIAEFQNKMIQEAAERQENLDLHRQKIQKEELEERRKQRERIENLQSQLDLVKADQTTSTAIGSLQHQLAERRVELDILRQRQKKLKADATEIEDRYTTLRSNNMALTAEHNELTRRYATPEEYETVVAAKKEDLRRETLFCDELKRYYETLEERKNDLANKQFEMEEQCRVQIEEMRVVQEGQVEENKAMLDEEMELLQDHESSLRKGIVADRSFVLNMLESDFWLGYNRASVVIRLRNAEETRKGLIEKVNEAKNEVSQLSYQTLILDDDIDRLTHEVSDAEKVKNELHQNLAKALSEIKDERARLTEALAGNGTQSFPLLDAQRELLENRFSLLQRCIALPALPLSSSMGNMTKSGIAGGDSSAAAISLSNPILTRQGLEEELTDLCKRLDDSITFTTIDNSHLSNALQSLEERRVHLAAEEELRASVLKQLHSADNELGKAISQLKDDIQQMVSDSNALQNANLRRDHNNSMVDEEEQRQHRDEEETVLKSISEAKIHLESLENQRSDNFRQMKMNQSRLNLLRQKKEEVLIVAKDIQKLSAVKIELEASLHQD